MPTTFLAFYPSCLTTGYNAPKQTLGTLDKAAAACHLTHQKGSDDTKLPPPTAAEAHELLNRLYGCHQLLDESSGGDLCATGGGAPVVKC